MLFVLSLLALLAPAAAQGSGSGYGLGSGWGSGSGSVLGPAPTYTATVSVELVMAGTVATVCVPSVLDGIKALMAAEIPGVEPSDMGTTCVAASVKLTLDISVPEGVEVASVTTAVNTNFADAQTASKFLQSLQVQVTSDPVVSVVIIEAGSGSGSGSGSPPPAPPALPNSGEIIVSFVVAGSVETVCGATTLNGIKSLIAAEVSGLSASDIADTCKSASVNIVLAITVPAGVTLASVQAVINTNFATAAAATAFLATLGLTVTQAPLVNGAVVSTSLLPNCDCNSFVNGLTTDSIGSDGCAKDEVHGLQGVQTLCYPATRPYIPHLDDGCPSDMYRCMISYTAPTFPACACSEYHNGAVPGSGNTCQKVGTSTCYARNYAGDKKIGGWEYYGCPEDMFRCS